jgi:hypothetical protein
MIKEDEQCRVLMKACILDPAERPESKLYRSVLIFESI